jgi:hypothetical protein
MLLKSWTDHLNMVLLEKNTKEHLPDFEVGKDFSDSTKYKRNNDKLHFIKIKFSTHQNKLKKTNK